MKSRENILLSILIVINIIIIGIIIGTFLLKLGGKI